MTSRRFFRCSCCLGVLALDMPGPAVTCGVCEGALEPMGSVYRSSKGGSDCPCDYRCTGALGPSCNCRCQGANHGSGLVVTLWGNSAAPVDRVESQSRAMEWKTSVADFEAQLAAMAPRRSVRGARVLRWARGCRVHRQRMAALRDFLAGSESSEGQAVLELDLGEACS